MARAFYDDPVMVWILSEESTRIKHLCRLFAALARQRRLVRGDIEVVCEASGIGAAALWDPPNQWQRYWWEQVMQLPTLWRVFGFRVERVHAVQKAMKQAHPEEPHWYLAAIGSDPTVRGRGYGQTLLRSRLDRCDAEHCPAYLESSKPENVHYYERFGFTVTGEIRLGSAGPRMWPMWREPR